MRGYPRASSPVGLGAWRDTTPGRGLWYPAGLVNAAAPVNNALALGANTLVTLPIEFPEEITIPSFGLWCTFTSGGQFFGMALYALTAANNSYPGSLLCEANSIPMTLGWQTKAVGYTVAAGTKAMLGFVGDAGCNVQFLTGSNTSYAGIGFPATYMSGGTALQHMGWSVAHAYVPGNGMPDPFPGGGALYPGDAAGRFPGLWIGGW